MRILLLFWALFALVVAYCKHVIAPAQASLWLTSFPAYNGSLTACLTYPARSRSIDTFSDILKEREEVTLYTYKYSSLTEILQESSNPVLQVW